MQDLYAEVRRRDSFERALRVSLSIVTAIVVVIGVIIIIVKLDNDHSSTQKLLQPAVCAVSEMHTILNDLAKDQYNEQHHLPVPTLDLDKLKALCSSTR